uniref:Uncharacterized protein n=1 Tax=Oryza brachyantha TaxID=4533 RepID=J3KYZ4_ORYBR
METLQRKEKEDRTGKIARALTDGGGSRSRTGGAPSPLSQYWEVEAAGRQGWRRRRVSAGGEVSWGRQTRGGGIFTSPRRPLFSSPGSVESWLGGIITHSGQRRPSAWEERNGKLLCRRCGKLASCVDSRSSPVYLVLPREGGGRKLTRRQIW